MPIRTLWDPNKGNLGCSIPRINNLTGTVDPAATDDLSKGYEAGSTWLNVTNGRLFTCMSAAAGVAVWALDGSVNAQLGSQPTPTAKTVSATLTGAEILAGIITVNQGGGAASNLQMPLATDWETAIVAAYGPLPAATFRQSFDFSVINISTVAAEVASITTNTGWTLVGDMSMAANATGDQSGGRFRAVRTAAATWSLYRIA